MVCILHFCHRDHKFQFECNHCTLSWKSCSSSVKNLPFGKNLQLLRMRVIRVDFLFITHICLWEAKCLRSFFHFKPGEISDDRAGWLVCLPLIWNWLSWGNTKMQKSGDRKVLTGEDETDFKWAGEATGLMWEMLMPVSLPSNSHLKLGQIQLSLSFFGNAPIFPAWACRKETRFKLQSHWKYHCLYLPLGMSPNSKTPTQPLYVDCHVLDLIYDRTENL